MRFLLKRFEDLNIESILVGIINAVIVVLAASLATAKHIGSIEFLSIIIVTSFANIQMFKNKTFDYNNFLISLWFSTFIFIFIKFFFLS